MTRSSKPKTNEADSVKVPCVTSPFISLPNLPGLIRDWPHGPAANTAQSRNAPPEPQAAYSGAEPLYSLEDLVKVSNLMQNWVSVMFGLDHLPDDERTLPHLRDFATTGKFSTMPPKTAMSTPTSGAPPEPYTPHIAWDEWEFLGGWTPKSCQIYMRLTIKSV